MADDRHSTEVPVRVSPEPLVTHLRDGLDEARIKEMWERIDHAPPVSYRPWALTVVSALAVLLLLLGASQLTRGAEPRQLVLVSGAAPAVLGSDSAEAVPRFDDGSAILLASGTRLEVLRNDARSFVTALRRGNATFDVKPGGPRHWIIEAGDVTVEVVGTRFRVERAVVATRVSVEHGVVIVRGERVPGGIMRLTAGRSLEVPAKVSPPPSASPRALLPPPATTVLEKAAPVAATRINDVPSPAGSSPPGPDVVDAVETLLRAADVARREHDSAAAIRHFKEAFARAAAGDTRRGLAGLSMARLLIAQDPAQAARILRSSLPDMPQALLEDASVRLVEAESRAGRRDAALQAAAEYRRRFPAGRREDEVRRWSEP